MSDCALRCNGFPRSIRKSFAQFCLVQRIKRDWIGVGELLLLLGEIPDLAAHSNVRTTST